jgi:RHS repeat-associated protein
VDLSALTQFQDVDNTTFDNGWTGWSSITPKNSGTIKAPALASVSGTILALDGMGTIPVAQLSGFTSGQINMSGGKGYAFTALANGAGTAVSVSGANTSASFPALSTLVGGSLSVNGFNSSATLPLLADISNGSIALEQGGTASVPLLANIGGASLSVADGATLAVPSATSYTNTQGELTTVTLKASGGGSVLDLHNVASVTQSTSRRVAMVVQAAGGGKVDLSGVTRLLDPSTSDTRGRSTQVTAQDSGSLVDLSALTQFQDVDNTTFDNGWTGWSSLTAKSGGTIKAPALGALNDVIATQDAGSQVQLVSGSLGGPVRGATGQLVISGPTTLTGTTLLNEGTIQLNSNLSADINANLQLESGSQLQVPPTASVSVAGNLLGPVSADSMQLNGTLQLDGAGTASSPQLLEVMSADLGDTPAGWATGALINQLTLANTTYVRLVSQYHNTAGSGTEAIYVNSLVVPAGTTLDLNGLHLYAHGSVVGGQIINGSVSQKPDSGPIAVNAPTPGSISVAGQVDEWSFFARAGRVMTIVVNPGSGSPPAYVAPFLNYARVDLLDASGTVLASGSGASSGQVVTLPNIAVPADGTYTIRVRAAASQPTSTGNYELSVWDTTPDVATIELNQSYNGQIESPYSVDSWTFAAVANQQVQFDLINRTNTNIVFTLTGPNNWTGFSNIGADSGLVTLPTTGTYTLTASGTGGMYGGFYAFRLNVTSQTDLALGASFTGSLPGSGSAQLFRVVVPQGTPMLVRLDDQSTVNHNELYAKLGSPPTRSDYDVRFGSPASPDQTLLVDRATPGTWYILVYGDSVPVASSFTLQAAASKVVLDQVTPAQLGNGAPMVMTLTGAGFTSGTALSLIAAGGTSYPAASTDVDGYTKLTTTFSAGSVPAGTYTVRATLADGTKANLTNAFVVTAGGAAQLQTHLVLPSALGWHGTAQIIVQYQNVGTVAMPSPLLDLSATVNGKEGGFFTLDPSIVTQGFWTSALPDGFSHSVQFLARGSVPGTLQPGESGNVTVYYAGWQQPWSLGSQFYFQLSDTEATDSTPIDWSSIKDAMRPPTISPEAWTPIFANLAANTGGTWGDYVRMLDENSAYLGRLGRDVYDIGKLLSFEVQQAIGMAPVQSIGTATDATVVAPGIDITFSRTFLAALDGRNNLGPLGRGWVWLGGWDLRSSVRSDGTIVISSGDGSQRLFQPDSRTQGVYFAQPLDYGTISNVNGRSLVLQERDGTRYGFDGTGHITSITDTNGNSITASYAGDNITRLTHSSGQFLQIDYNAAGRIIKLTDPVGRLTTFTYDASNEHLLSVTDFDGTVTSYQYASGPGAALANALTLITSPSHVNTHLSYDSEGRLASIFGDGNVEVTSFSYDTAGTVSITTPASAASPGGTTRYFHDERGQIDRIENQLGFSTYYTRDAVGDLLRVTDSDGRSTAYAYGRDGLMTSETDALGNTTTFAYNGPFDRMTSFVDALGRATGYTYDAKGNLVAITYPDASQEQWTYDAIGDVATSANRRDQLIRYGYDSAGRLTSKTYPDGSVDTYTYDPRGNLVSTSDPTGTTSYSYQAGTDRLLEITYPGNHTLAFTYCDCGRRATMTDETGYVLLYNYDDNGHLASLSDSNSITQVTYTYDSEGLLQRKDLANGVYTTYAYDAAGQVLHLVNHEPDGSALSRFDYAYDDRGLRTSMDTVDGKWTYQYDDLGQLTGWTDPQNHSTSFVYDALGNRLSETDNGVITNYTVNNLNQYTQVGNTTYTYDADGNMVTRTDPTGTTTYSYNADNRLVRTQIGTNVWTNTYDALGNRVATTAQGVSTTFVIDPAGLGNVVGEYLGTTQVVRNVYGLGLIARQGESGASFFTFDAVGSTSEITGAGGSVQAHYGYTPFGRPTTVPPTLSNPYQFIGEYGVRSESNELDWMRARSYSNELASFTSQDPLGIAGGLNLYTYAHTDPVAYIDPSGLYSPCKIICQGAAGGAGALGAWATSEMGPVCIFIGGTIYGAGGEFCSETCDMLPDLPPIEFGPDPPAWYPPGYPPPTDGQIPDPHSPPPNQKQPPNVLPPPKENPPPGSGDPVPPVQGVDPNQMTGPAGYGSQNYVSAQSILPYRIDFENEATATAPAQEVEISNTLSPSLDWNTLQFTSVGWGDTFIAIPEGRSFYRTTMPMTENGQTFLVQVELGLRTATGEVYAQFLSIDPKTGLPPDVLTGFLPPEDGTGRGMGFFTYTVQPKAGLATGTEIRNVALVKFDRGTAIATNQVDDHNPAKGTDPAKEALVTIDAGPPSSSVAPLPAVLNITAIPLSWSGSDTGSGVVAYTIDVSTDGGPFVPFLTNTTQISTTFTGQFGHRYAFYSVATDGAGNVQPTPASAQTSTTLVSTDTTPPTSTVSPLPATVIGPSFTVAWSGTDNTGGTGIASYDVFVSDNGATFLPFQTHTTQLSATFAGTVGHTYGFYSVATDLAGNRQATPGSAQATTQVVGSMAVLQFASHQFTANETTGTTAVSLTRAGNLGATVTVIVSSPGGPGVAAFQTTVTFGPNVSTQTLAIPIANDGLPGSADAAISLTLSSPSAGASLGDAASASLVIHDDNPPLDVVTSLRVATVKVGTGKKAKSATGLVLQFSEAVNAAQAQNLAAYQLSMAGKDKKFGTKDDKIVPLASATYNATAHTVTLIPRQAFNKTQLQQLRVKAPFLHDSLGRVIDGNHDGQPSGDFVATVKGKAVTVAASAIPKSTVISPLAIRAIDQVLAVDPLIPIQSTRSTSGTARRGLLTRV